MNLGRRLIRVCFIIIVLEYSEAQERFDDNLPNDMEYIKDIPRKLVLKGDSAKSDFKKYANEIQSLTAGRNLTAVYKITVELLKPDQKLIKKKKLFKKTKSKKYNVPLKKQNMKLSNFEVILRKLAEEYGQTVQSSDTNSELTTVKINKNVSVKPIQLKYKPIVGRLKTNYTKIVKPVRNKLITLTS